MNRWPIAILVFFLLLGVGAIALLFQSIQSSAPPMPANMPTQDQIRTYLLDCEQFNPGRQCIVVAMPVPDFSDRGSE